MEIFGIGPLELLLIMLLALIILGPKDMQKIGKNLGQALNKLVKSDTWKTVRQASEKMKTLPNDLMREAELDELQKTFKNSLEETNRIAPPSSENKSPEKITPASSENKSPE
jgi:sec-independent protein translocase protein TatB